MFSGQHRILVDLSFANRLILTLLYVVMLLLAFGLMLLVMTFNYPILLVLCFGLALGHLAAQMVGLPKLPGYYS